MTSPLDLLKRPLVAAILALVAGIILGLIWGWLIQPVTYSDVTPELLRSDLQVDYMRMTIDSFRVNRDPNLAVQRWVALGPAASPAFVAVKKDPRGMDPAVIDAYGQVIQTVLKIDPAKSSSAAQPSKSSGGIILAISLLVLLIVGGAVGFFFLRPLLAKRSSGEVTPAMQATAVNREAAKSKTNFETMGVAPPITQNMTTYVLGDDLYDESFSIDTASGDFLGEYGVGVSETIGVGDPKKVTALEIWLFDKEDIKTATKVLMSAHAFNDAGSRSRLEAKGELVQVEPQKQVMLETQTLQLLATVVDLQYGNSTMPDKSYFERVTLELAIWRKSDQQ